MEKYKEYFTPVAILVMGAMISFSILAAEGGINLSFEKGKAGDQAADEPAPSGDTAPSVTANDYIRGNPNAPITIVEFSDFQCPFCRQFHPTVQQAFNEYGDKVRWVYRHFPLTQIHPNAQPAAEASECVGEQKGSEGFWQFADAMFAQQERLGADFYREQAGQIGVNLTQFDTCVATRKYKDKVEAQMQEGMKLGVNGTPGTFVNAVPVRGALPYANFKAIIDVELARLGSKGK